MKMNRFWRVKIIALSTILLIFSACGHKTTQTVPADKKDETKVQTTFVIAESNDARRSPYIGPDTGDLLWSQGDVGQTTPVVSSDGTIYVLDDNLKAFNADGSIKWIYPEGYTTTPVIGSDGTIYFFDILHLRAVNPNGTLKWEHEAEQDYNGDYSIAIGIDGSIYYCGYPSLPRPTLKNIEEEYWLYLYSTTPEGIKKWSYKRNLSVDKTPIVGNDGTIYIHSALINTHSCSLHAVNPDGTNKWIFDPESVLISNAVINVDNTVYLGTSGKIYAINSDGTQKWQYTTESKELVHHLSIDADGYVYAACDDCYLYVLKRDGSLKWKFKTSDVISSEPTIGADGTVYVGSHDKNLYAINSDGSLKWKFIADSSIESSPAIGIDGTLFVTSSYGTLYAIGTGSGKKRLFPPENVNASDNQFDNKVNIKWSVPKTEPVPDGYYVYRALQKYQNYFYIGKTTELEFDDMNAKPGITYSYKVKSYKFASGYNDSPLSESNAGSVKID